MRQYSFNKSTEFRFEKFVSLNKTICMKTLIFTEYVRVVVCESKKIKRNLRQANRKNFIIMLSAPWLCYILRNQLVFFDDPYANLLNLPCIVYWQ